MIQGIEPLVTTDRFLEFTCFLKSRYILGVVVFPNRSTERINTVKPGTREILSIAVLQKRNKPMVQLDLADSLRMVEHALRRLSYQQFAQELNERPTKWKVIDGQFAEMEMKSKLAADQFNKSDKTIDDLDRQLSRLAALTEDFRAVYEAINDAAARTKKP